MKKIILIVSVFFVLFISISIPDVFAHGLGGDQAPPISFGGMDVTVFTQLNPSDITVGEIDKANMGIRFFDLLTDQNLEAVTYRIEIWRGDDLLARELFYDSQGQLDVEIRPDTKCDNEQLIHCTQYFGERELISNGLMKRGTQFPVIDGPIFDKGGLYNIRVDIEGASSPKTLVAQPLRFETFVSVAQEQDFFIQTANAEEVPVIVKTYYDDVDNFQFDQLDNSVSFDMSFNWNPQYVEQVKVVHEEIRVPKTFEPYQEGTQYKGYVNGVELGTRAVLSDPYSSDDQNIIHFLVTGNELKRINEEFSLDKHNIDNAFFELIPITGNKKNSINIDFDSNVKVTIEWDDDYDLSKGIPFDLTFFDDNGNLIRDVKYGFTLYDENKSVIFTNIGDDSKNPGILASEGLDTQMISISEPGLYEIEVGIFGTGIGTNPDLKFSGLGSSGIFEIGSISPSTVPEKNLISIPNWVRNNASWWSEGSISDEDFASGIQFMIKDGIIKVPVTKNPASSSDVEIPQWVRNNASWWSEGSISDEDFAKGLEFLVENGVIKV
ncbi:blue copper domain-containing protein [Marine Group I thaumarchaeote SCGC AAA799-E16]|uniref:Blue copper domain-containing protein n=3 Tax=Marine Group I TaxID=905826 RepID=A0A087S9A7_9ARCH|nr:blue copper domain-containing protein [Marine Group I thaumarchaeote SCGC AAA799-E16]KFM18428.1 blue copper domain-containing protein [Marine Group I thaumarchaeote SCGC RSA3]KFM22311.1 blue copper domain-containing protein [Marine Group I thaumarchaeote SCGC AAA799-B03]